MKKTAKLINNRKLGSLKEELPTFFLGALEILNKNGLTKPTFLTLTKLT